VTSEAWDAKNTATPKHKKALRNVALVETRSHDFLSRDQRHHFLRHIGETYARCLELDYSASKECTDDAQKYLGERLESVARTWYVGACCASAGAIFLVWLVAMIGGKQGRRRHPRACAARESRLRNRRAEGCDLCDYVRSCPDNFDVLRNSTAGFLLAGDVYRRCLTELVSTRALKQSRRMFLTKLLPTGSTC
jgi:hypothetical protein